MADMTPQATQPRNAGRIFTIIAFVLAVIALFFLPPILGLAAVILGIIGAYRGDKPLGWYAAGAGVACAIIGMILGYLLTH
jgi:hypothetical protein